MALQAAGQIKLTELATEFGGTAPYSLKAYYRSGGRVPSNNSNVPTSGALGLKNFYNAVNRFSLGITIPTSTTQTSINVTAVSGYIAGISDIAVYVSSGVYVYPTSIATPALTFTGGTAGDTVTLVNNGFIQGARGSGGSGSNGGGGPGGAGGPALSLGYSISLTNNGSIAGGGGGGGGGGGANYTDIGTGNNFTASGASGGTGAGANGQGATGGGTGGFAGGVSKAGNGGSGGALGTAGSPGQSGNSGGGGSGGAAGKAVNLLGYTITYITTGTINGAVS